MERLIKIAAWVIGWIILYGVSVLLLPISILAVAIIFAAELKNKLTTAKKYHIIPHPIEGDCGKNSKN